MFELLSNGALPLGMLFLGLTLWRVLRRQAGNVVARAAYPGLAARLGLKHHPSGYKQGVGRLSGQFKGFAVAVDPDDQRRIFVRFARQPEVLLASYRHNKRPKGNMVDFRPQAPELRKLFKTSQAAPELVERLQENEQLFRRLEPLGRLREMSSLILSESGVTAVFDYGNPPYIPAGVVQDVLPRLVELASAVEAPEERSGGGALQ